MSETVTTNNVVSQEESTNNVAMTSDGLRITEAKLISESGKVEGSTSFEVEGTTTSELSTSSHTVTATSETSVHVETTTTESGKLESSFEKTAKVEEESENVNSETITEQTNQQIPEQTNQQIPEQTSQQILEQTSQQILEQTSQQILEQTSQQIPEQTSQQTPEQTSQQILEQTSQQIPEQTSQQILEQTSQQIPEQLNKHQDEPESKTENELKPVSSQTETQEQQSNSVTEQSNEVPPVEKNLPIPDPSTETGGSPVIERKEIKETLQEIIKEIDKEVIKDFQRSECKSVTTDKQTETVSKEEGSQQTVLTTQQDKDNISSFKSSSSCSFNVKKISSTGHGLWTPSGTVLKGTEQPFGESLLKGFPSLDYSPIPPIWVPPKVAYTPVPLPDLPDIPATSGPTDISLSSSHPTEVPVQQRNGVAPSRPTSLPVDQQNGVKEEYNMETNPPSKNLLMSISGPDMPECRKLSQEELKKIFTPAEDAELISPTNRKMYASSYFYKDPKNLYPTVEEQLELAKKISESLSSDINKQSKGQDMFERRKRKSHKWVHEELLSGDTVSSTTMESYSHTVNGQTTSDQSITHTRKPALKLVLNPVSIREWSTANKNIYSDVSALSPEICADLVKDLQQPKGKGAMLFAKRKKKSENWVVDSANRKNPAEAAVGAAPPPPKVGFAGHSLINTGAVTSLGKAIDSQTHKLEEIQMRLSQPKVKLVKSPWEAALETGSVDTAFQTAGPQGAAGVLVDSVLHAAFSQPVPPAMNTLPPTPPIVAEPPPQLLPPSELLKAKSPQGWDSSGYTPRSITPTPVPQPTPQLVHREEKRPNVSEFGTKNYNTAPRGWGQFQNYYRPVTFSSIS